MKNLRIPTSSEQSVDLSEIINDFPGIVIAYNNDKAVGYIQYYDGSWFLVNNIDSYQSFVAEENTLFELVTELIKRNLCTHFKVIEFAQ